MLTRAGILGAASGPQNLIQNGAFNSPDTLWALNAANISGGTLNFVNSGYGSAIQSTGPRWVAGATYAITYTVSNYTSGSVAFRMDGSVNVGGAFHSANGTYTENLIAPAGIGAIRLFEGSGNGNFSIDNASAVLVPLSPIQAMEPILYGHSLAWGQGSTIGTDAYGNVTGEGGNFGAVSGLFNTAGGYIGHEEGFPGYTSTQLLTEIVNHPDLKTHPVLLWIGRNNAGDPTTVMSDLANMIAYIGHSYYLILYEAPRSGAATYNDGGQETDGTGGTISTTARISLDYLNAAYASTYPGKTVNWLTFVCTDPGHLIPQSMLSDTIVHPNDAGYSAIFNGGGVKAAYDTMVAPILSPADLTPNALPAFTPQDGLFVSTLTTSNTIRISGISGATPISVTGGAYSKNGGAFVTTADTVVDGDYIALQNTSSASLSTALTTTVTIGGVSGSFVITTAASGDIILNGSFTSGANWTLGAGVTISGGALNFAAANFSLAEGNTSPALVAGVTYRMRWSITAWTAGSVTPRLVGSGGGSGVSRGAIGSYVDDIVAPAGVFEVRFSGATSNDTLSVSNVTIVQMP